METFVENLNEEDLDIITKIYIKRIFENVNLNLENKVLKTGMNIQLLINLL